MTDIRDYPTKNQAVSEGGCRTALSSSAGIFATGAVALQRESGVLRGGDRSSMGRKAAFRLVNMRRLSGNDPVPIMICHHVGPSYRCRERPPFQF